MRASVVAVVVLLAVFLSGPAPHVRPVVEDGSGLPITITGQTGQWNGMTRSYDITGRFRRSGNLYLEDDPTGSGTAIGIFSGSVIDFSAGALHVVSNSYLLRHDDAITDFDPTAMLTVATVEQDGSDLVATIDPAAARTVQMNSFGVSDSALTAGKQILQGTVRVTGTGQSMHGEIELYGGGYIEPGNGAFPVDIYKATFSS